MSEEEPTVDDHYNDIEFLKKLCDTHESPSVIVQEIVRYLESNLKGLESNAEETWENIYKLFHFIPNLKSDVEQMHERIAQLEKNLEDKT